jgi:hypothetical protein
MEENRFEDEIITFMVKAIVISGCIFALLPSLVRAFTNTEMTVPLSGRLYLDPDTGRYWVYVPEGGK